MGSRWAEWFKDAVYTWTADTLDSKVEAPAPQEFTSIYSANPSASDLLWLEPLDVNLQPPLFQEIDWELDFAKESLTTKLAGELADSIFTSSTKRLARRVSYLSLNNVWLERCVENVEEFADNFARWFTRRFDPRSLAAVLGHLRTPSQRQAHLIEVKRHAKRGRHLLPEISFATCGTAIFRTPRSSTNAPDYSYGNYDGERYDRRLQQGRKVRARAARPTAASNSRASA
jgi:hypothetical protein